MNNCPHLIAGCMRWGSWGAGFLPVQMQDYLLFCLENGIHTFDHADIYGDYTTETDFGDALHALHLDRKQLQIISKCGIERPCSTKPGLKIKKYNSTKAYIIKQAETSLQNLQTDYLDLLLLHRPDPLMQGEEVAAAFETLYQTGKVLRFGVSNFSITQLQYLKSFYPNLDTNQIELSWQANEAMFNGQLLFHAEAKIQTQAWSPLGKWAEITDSKKNALEAIATKYDTDAATLLLVWLWHHPEKIQCILGTTKKDRIQAALLAKNIKMHDEDWYAILKIANGKDVA